MSLRRNRLIREAQSLEQENANQHLKRRSESIGDNSGPLHKIRAIEAEVDSQSNAIIQSTRNNTNRMDVQMRGDNDGDDGAERGTLATTGPAGNNPQSKETQISTYPSLSYGFQETHTTIIPWTGWLSVIGLTTSNPQQLQIRMNSICDWIVTGKLG